jgi:hypothetical protein
MKSKIHERHEKVIMVVSKKLLFFSFVFMGLSFISIKDAVAPREGTLSKKERQNAIKLLKDTENDVLSKLKGLSEAQLKFKPAPDRWSVEECLKHIAVTEQALWQMTSGTLKQPANPDKRSEIKMTDEQLITMLEDRTQKKQTMDQFKPENTPYKSADDAVASFKGDREKLIGYVRSTQEDLRNHVATMPFGMIDCYQLILFIGAHSNRHAQQIAEVMADPGFPKS